MPVLTLMNADYEVAKILCTDSSKVQFTIIETLDSKRLPLGLPIRDGEMGRPELNDWWRCRSVLRSCPGLELKLSALCTEDSLRNVPQGLGISLSDCYWLRPEGAEALQWKDVNYLDNDYIATAPDEWDAQLSGANSCFTSTISEVELPKRWIIGEEGTRLLLKGCRTDDQRPYNELAATRLFERLCFPGEFVSYSVVQTADGPASSCPNFLQSYEEFIPAAALWKSMQNVSGGNEFQRLCAALDVLGIEENQVRQHLATMVICDVLLANTDRHWRNFGIIRNVDTLGLRLAPIFDTGNCLWYSASDRDVERGVYKAASQASPANRLKQFSLSCLDPFPRLEPKLLEGFAEQACETISMSSHMKKPGRLKFVYSGIIKNINHVVGIAAR